METSANNLHDRKKCMCVCVQIDFLIMLNEWFNKDSDEYIATQKQQRQFEEEANELDQFMY